MEEARREAGFHRDDDNGGGGAGNDVGSVGGARLAVDSRATASQGRGGERYEGERDDRRFGDLSLGPGGLEIGRERFGGSEVRVVVLREFDEVVEIYDAVVVEVAAGPCAGGDGGVVILGELDEIVEIYDAVEGGVAGLGVAEEDGVGVDGLAHELGGVLVAGEAEKG